MQNIDEDKPKMFEATLPFFSGFYTTYAGEAICSVDESELDNIADELESNKTSWIDEDLHAEFKACVKPEDVEKFIQDLLFDYVNGYDYRGAQMAYCDAYAGVVCDMLKIPYMGMEMDSPRYYNFETDKIHIKLIPETLRAWVDRLHHDNELQSVFEGILKDRCTSYDGFMSFHSNSLEDYLELPIDDWCNIKAGLLLEALLLSDCPDEMSEGYASDMAFVDELHEGLSGNGFSHEYALDIDKVLAKCLAEYRDNNPYDDYAKRLPSHCLKGEIVTFNR